MIVVRDIMTTKLVTVSSDDTLGHAANLLRQRQFHHLPVTRTLHLSASDGTGSSTRRKALLFEGILTSQDIDLAAALAEQNTPESASSRPWPERRVVEMMHRGTIRVTPTTTVAAAAQILVERGLNYLPVVEYSQAEQETRTLLVGLLTRSDLLIALARFMGAFEPGMQVDIALPLGDMSPLARLLQLASELHVSIRSVIATPAEDGPPRVATVRLGTINPTALLEHLQQEGIQYSFGESLVIEGGKHA